MSRRDNVEQRCPACLMFRTLCICALIPRLQTRTSLLLVMHRDEARKPTNTGRLAARCLISSEVRVRGNKGEAPFAFTPDPERRAVLLFPADDAVPIVRFAESERPVTLIVPDGTWRQAGKMRARVPGLAALPCVSLPPGPPTAYGLRAETHPSGLATLEAIARAFELLEGANGPMVRAEMERVFRVMVDRTRILRGQSAASASPVPPTGAIVGG